MAEKASIAKNANSVKDEEKKTPEKVPYKFRLGSPLKSVQSPVLAESTPLKKKDVSASAHDDLTEDLVVPSTPNPNAEKDNNVGSVAETCLPVRGQFVEPEEKWTVEELITKQSVRTVVAISSCPVSGYSTTLDTSLPLFSDGFSESSESESNISQNTMYLSSVKDRAEMGLLTHQSCLSDDGLIKSGLKSHSLSQSSIWQSASTERTMSYAVSPHSVYLNGLLSSNPAHLVCHILALIHKLKMCILIACQKLVR